MSQQPSNSKILIAEDHTFTRLGLRRFLESEGFEVLEAACAQEAQEIIDNTPFDDAILDIEMPENRGGTIRYGSNAGLRLARSVKGKYPHVGVVLLSSHPDRGRDFWDMVSQGHRGLAYLLKNGDPSSLLDVIRQTQAHRIVCDDQVTHTPQFAEEVRKRLSPDEQPCIDYALREMPALTPREQAIVSALCESCDIKGIAQKLGIGENAVSNHITRIYEKLGLNQIPNSLSSRTLLIKASLIFDLQKEHSNGETVA